MITREELVGEKEVLFDEIQKEKQSPTRNQAKLAKKCLKAAMIELDLATLSDDKDREDRDQVGLEVTIHMVSAASLLLDATRAQAELANFPAIVKNCSEALKAMGRGKT